MGLVFRGSIRRADVSSAVLVCVCQLCVALEVVTSLCVDPPSAQVLHAFGASKVVCVIAVK